MDNFSQIFPFFKIQKLVRVVLLITIISQNQIAKPPTPFILKVYMCINLKADLTVFSVCHIVK